MDQSFAPTEKPMIEDAEGSQSKDSAITLNFTERKESK
jgi:hypothetical protein